MATNYDIIEPICSVKWWSPAEQRNASVLQPKLFTSYKSGLGGVDISEQAGNYRIGVQGRKWWWVLCTQMLNVAVVSA